jgi:hypothetical protein
LKKPSTILHFDWGSVTIDLTHTGGMKNARDVLLTEALSGISSGCFATTMTALYGSHGAGGPTSVNVPVFAEGGGNLLVGTITVRFNRYGVDREAVMIELQRRVVQPLQDLARVLFKPRPRGSTEELLGMLALASIFAGPPLGFDGLGRDDLSAYLFEEPDFAFGRRSGFREH